MELNKIFDKIYYCCCNTNNSIIEEFKANNITNIEVKKYTLDKKYYEYSNPKKILFYDIIKEAYNKKYNRIIILTDDIKFTDNKAAIGFYLSKYSNNDICILNPGDIFEDCFIISKNAIGKIYSYIQRIDYKIDKNQVAIHNFITKNIHIVKTPEPLCLHKIDYVISYVDSSDKVWFEEYSKYAPQVNDSFNKINRFRSFDILNYHLRSIHTNMNWINNIYLIVSGETQVPEWITDKVKVVYHHQIIPKAYLPTYNSTTIEAFMCNIPGLSEYFIYANDDMFVTKKLNRIDFYKEGKIITSYKSTDKNTNYIHHCKNGYNIVSSEFKTILPFSVFNHVPHPFIKSSCYHIHKTFSNQIYTRLTKFRNYKNFNQYIFLYYELLRGNFIQCPISLYYTEVTNSGLDLDINKANKCNFMCINDNASQLTPSLYKIAKNDLNLFLETLYPVKSPYEGTIINKTLKNKKQTKSSKYKIALCAIAKNENLYIKEWVEYYKKLGIKKIFLYDNNEINGERFEDVIENYIKSGFVEIIDVRGVEKGKLYDEDGINLQPKCYIDCYENRVSDYDYVCFFDIDEFLELNTSNINNVFDTLKDAYTILVPWIHYDDNNLLKYENKPVVERFTKKSSHQRYAVKSIVKTGSKIEDKTINCLIHNFLTVNKKVYFSNGNICELNNINNWYMVKPTEIDNCMLYLRHYKTKSLEEFMNRQLNRKWGTGKKHTDLPPLSVFDCEYRYFLYNDYTEDKKIVFNEYYKKEYEDAKIIVNFTTWKKRDWCVKEMLQHFNKQTLKPDSIICWLSIDEYDYDIPQTIKECLKEDLITEVKWVKGNIYGHKRWETFKYNRNDFNIFIDDDLYYPIDYIESLIDYSYKYPGNVICYYSRTFNYDSGKRLVDTYINNPSLKNAFFSGLCCFPPKLYPMDSFNFIEFRDKYTTKCDDSWVNAWCIKSNIKIKGIHEWKNGCLKEIKNTRETSIWENVNKIENNGIMQKYVFFTNTLKMLKVNKVIELWPNIYNIKK